MTALSPVAAANRSPVSRDFPFRFCIRCGFPIRADDLGGSEFQPLHSSSCTDQRTSGPGDPANAR